MKAAKWFVRIAFTAVFAINVHCSLSFVLTPGDYAAAYELSGVAGEAAIQGIGIAFLMWNATYPAFIVAPQRFRVLGWVILAQQAIGLVGEALLLANLTNWTGVAAGHEMLAASITRFIIFDGVGLVLMSIAFVSLLIVDNSR